jgi:hypothetical protein
MDSRTIPGDQKVPVRARDWNALKLAAWRSRAALEISAREAAAIIDRCGHMTGCAGKEDETAPCLPDCPDRELRLSALVILGAARMLAPADARRPGDGSYTAPSREYFSEIMATLAAAQIELEALHEAGAHVEPPPNAVPATLPAPSQPSLLPEDFEDEPQASHEEELEETTHDEA